MTTSRDLTLREAEAPSPLAPGPTALSGAAEVRHAHR